MTHYPHMQPEDDNTPEPKPKRGRRAKRSHRRSNEEKAERKALALRILQNSDPNALPKRLSARQARRSRIISLWLAGAEPPEIAATLKLSQGYTRLVIADAEKGVEEWEVSDALRLVKSAFLAVMDCHRLQTRELLGQFARTEMQRDRCLDWIDRLSTGEYVPDGTDTISAGIDLSGLEEQTGDNPGSNPAQTRAKALANQRERALQQALWAMSSEVKEHDTTIRTILSDLQKGHAATIDVLTRMGVPGRDGGGDIGSHTPREIPLISGDRGGVVDVDEVKRLQVESLERQLAALKKGEEKE